MRAADVIVQSLAAHGVKRAYCVPGESYLALLDALHGSPVETIVCRHESGAGFMAVAEAKLTGVPGVCLVSRGPGATNASIAVHVAQQDAVPLVLFIGQVAREDLGRGAFQEVDYGRFFGTMAKAVFEVNDADRLGEMVTRAFQIAASGVAGPVVVSLPEDMLEDETENAAPAPCPIGRPAHSAADAARLQSAIGASERPILIAGALMRGLRGAAALARFAEAQRIPVAASWKNQDVFDNGSPLYAGHIGFGVPAAYAKMLAEADLVIACGTRLGDVASLNYTFPKAQRLVHIYPDPSVPGRVFPTDLAIIADPVPLLEDLGREARVFSSAHEHWVSAINGFVRGFQEFSVKEMDDGVDFGVVVAELARQAPANAIITTDAGNMSTWVHRHWKMTPANTLLGAIAGAMGFGTPAAVAAQLAQPSRKAICFVGDGGALMTGQELATALQYGAAPLIVISDNGSYGTIRTHQEKHYPGRVAGTKLVNPDFTAWAKAFGAEVVTIANNSVAAEGVARALASEKACVIHAKASLKAISAYTTM
jgi:acetolactate synthase I/II/III large subunit